MEVLNWENVLTLTAILLSVPSLVISFFSYRLSKQTARKLRDYDYQTLSGVHDTLTQIRNMVFNKFRPHHLEEQRLENLKQLVFDALGKVPLLQRLFGQEWANEYSQTLVDTLSVTKKLMGRDVEKELLEIQALAENVSGEVYEAKVRQFLSDWNREEPIIKQLDAFINQIRSKMG